MAKPVLITRPEQDAAPLASRVAYLGGDPVLCPLLTIRYLDAEIDLKGVQGLLFTSANGVRAFARLCEERSLPVYAVGNATATEAEKEGFQDIKAAAGDVHALARLVADNCSPGNGEFFHAAGSKLAGDLSGLLGASGFVTRRATLYEADKATNLPDNAAGILRSGQQAIALFYSPRTARAFVELAEQAGLDSNLGSVTALCLSHAVAEKISSYQWAKVVVADKPEQDSLLGQLQEILANDMADEKNQDSQGQDHEQEEHLTDAVDAEALIEAFGGIRPMANKLDVAVSTVQGWKLRNHIPPARLEEVEKAAQENDIDLSEIIHKPEESGDTSKAAEAADAEPVQSAEKHGKPDEETKVETTPVTEKPATQTTTPSPAPAKGSNKLAWTALLASLAVGTALVLQPYWAPSVNTKLQPVLEKAAPNVFKARSPQTAGSAPGQEVTALKGEFDAQLSALTRQMDGLASAISALEGQETVMAADGNTDILKDRLQAMQDRLTALEEVGGGAASAPAADVAALKSQLAQLEADKDAAITEAASAREALQNALDAQGRQAGTLASRVTELASRLQSVETVLDAMATEPAVRNQQEIALVVAAGQLEVQALEGRKYADALTTLEALTKDMPELHPAIAALKEGASTGVATRTGLLQSFQVMAARIDTPIKDADQTNWVDATLANISGLVSVRRTGAEPDMPPMSRAEAALHQDDLAGAIDALTPLADSRPDVADWLKAARQRLAVEEAIGTLRAEAAKRLSLASVTPDNTISRAAQKNLTDDTAKDEASQ
ncbi:uroporphyrinogen-III synthase [Aestuariispira ectoiniformans]|uniref:uroporphyrinogen-III synthase n=1 Tax=Aestuariispira ectoiniformans TaxID=2775080 RepID=UPI00223BF8EA|nr:uroporphyrinogen-III synthase [Aestuariispira ectoiniformans]